MPSTTKSTISRKPCSCSPSEQTSLENRVQGDLYNQVLLDSRSTCPSRSCSMPGAPSSVQAGAGKHDHAGALRRTGEHFQPGMDSVDNPTRAPPPFRYDFLPFRPDQDVRFRKRLSGGDDPQLAKAQESKGEIILTEMIKDQEIHGIEKRKKMRQDLLFWFPSVMFGSTF